MLSESRKLELSKEARNKELSKRLSLIYANDIVKPVYAPFETLGLEIINKLPAIDGTILVLSDCGLLVSVLCRLKAEGKNRSSVSFVAHNIEQEIFASQVGVTKIYQVGYNEPIKELEKQLMGMKFDIIVGNPPYLKGLHMKFMYLGFDTLTKIGKLIFVHPATEFVKQGRGVDRKDLKPVIPFIKSLNIQNPSKFFPSADLNSPISITYLDKSKLSNEINLLIDGKECDIENFDDISIHTLKTGYLEFKNNTLGVRCSKTSLKDITKWGKNGNYNFPVSNRFFIETSGLMGNTGGFKTGSLDEFFEYDFAIFFGKTKTVVSKNQLENTSAKYAFGFDSKEEAESCLSYLKTNFARACLYIFKYNLHVYPDQLSTVPLVPFDRTWTDEMLKEYFKLSEDECSYIDSLPKYY